MTNVLMAKDYEDKRKKKILDNGKNNVQSVFSTGPFTVLPRRAFNDKRIAQYPVTLIILGTLCTCANNFTGVCFPTYQYIVNATGKTLPTISIAINRLIDWGYIKRLRKGSPLYKNVKHKSSIYRILYDPSASDEEVRSRALSNDPELQMREEAQTIDKLEENTEKSQTFSSDTKRDFSLTLNKTRLIELDSDNILLYTNKEEQKMTEIEMMTEFKQIHREVFQSEFRPARKDWEQINLLLELGIPDHILLATIKRNLYRAKKPPTYPLAWILHIMSENPDTPQSIIKHIAKLLKRTKRNYD